MFVCLFFYWLNQPLLQSFVNWDREQVIQLYRTIGGATSQKRQCRCIFFLLVIVVMAIKKLLLHCSGLDRGTYRLALCMYERTNGHLAHYSQ